LDGYNAVYETRDIKTDNPSYDELKGWLELSGLPVRKFFNTSGLLYKSLGLKDKLASMNEDECLKLLATDGMLVKRPMLVDEDRVLVGFDSNEWKSALEDMVFIPDTVTVEITDNDIDFPWEWFMNGKIEHGYVQITLVDDRIVVHKPTAADVEYKAPCKAGENSYIRSFGLYSVRVPKQLLQQLDIKTGDKADLTLEENCISIRKNMDVEPAPPPVKTPEPLMAFCCVCGSLLYTGNALVKVASKHICRECVELVKSL
jgi:arsenate reductase